MIVDSTPWQKKVENEDLDFYVTSQDEEGLKDLLEQYQVDVVETTPSEFTEFAVRVPYKGEFKSFDFTERRYLRAIYDTPAQRRILMAGRQVEKCVLTRSFVSTKDGSFKLAGDVQVGDWLACMDVACDARTTTGCVSWVSKKFSKPCVRIHTRQGHFVEVAKTHPMRQWDRWTEAGALNVGDRLAVVRRCGEFMNDSLFYDAQRIILTAYLIGDGSLGGGLGFTSAPGPKLDEFRRILSEYSLQWREYTKPGSDTVDLRLNYCHITGWMEEDGLLGKKSKEKFVPGPIFAQSREKTALFLNRLWSTDGHVKQNTRSKYSLEYCSISERLVSDVQALLWKFGIPSKIRSFVPELYKDKEREDGAPKVAFILRIETQDGVRRFLTEIGALGKGGNVSLPESDENNNRDTYPIEVQGLIQEILASRGKDDWHENRRHSLFSFGLRRTLKYPPTKAKLLEYVRFFRTAPDFDQELVDRLAAHLDTDLYWDEIVEIENIGEQECVDFEIEDQHNFVANGFVVHNSTLLGNQSISYSCIVPSFRTLYVSPSHQQTKTFSNDRVKEPIELSSVLKAFAPDSLISNILERKFANRSQITFRFAFLNADRCLAGDTRVQLADGRAVPIRDLVGSEAVGVVAARENGSPVLALGTQARSTGVRDVVRVHTSFPIPLVCTRDHRILTGRGWVEAQDLKEGDYIAAPHPWALLEETSIGEDTAWLLGALISEGESFDKRSLRFSNTDEDFVLEFEERAKALGIPCGDRVVDRRYERTCYTISLYSDGRGAGLRGGKAALWELGEFGEKAEDKHIPACIFKASLQEKATFLRALFRGDGWCTPEGDFGRAGYCTASKRLAEDLALLLWGLGIRSRIRWRLPSTEGALGSFTLDFSTTDTAKLVALTGEYRPGLDYRAVAGKSIKDRLPFSYEWLRHYLAENYSLTTHTAWTKHRIQLRPGNRKDSIGRRVLLDIARKLNDWYLETLADPSTAWVEVERLEEAGREEVFDLTVEGPECFQANGLIVHNCRGIPADNVLIDEFQDILIDNVPVIEECASHSAYKLFTYAGTPKSLDGSLEHYWSRYSTQNEWVVPCRRHGTPGDPGSWHWNILTEESIGDEGLICDRCGSPINAMDPDSQWAAMNPNPKVEKPFEGFRIPQLMVPWIEWSDIRHKHKHYPRAKFYNEVLGRSFDSGTRPLTRQDIIDNCNPKLSMRHYAKVKKWAGQTPIFMGLDWGTGEGAYTVMTLGGYLPFAPDRFTYFYYKRFDGLESEPKVQLEIIKRTAREFNVAHIGADYGMGHWPNDELLREFGAEKVHKYQWVGNVKKKIKWDPQLGVPRFLCHRTEVMSDYFNAMKRRNVFNYPRWEEMYDPFALDFLNVISEYNDRLRMNVYKHPPGMPDDSCHASIFCFLASFYYRKRPDVILPTREVDRELRSPEDDHEELDTF